MKLTITQACTTTQPSGKGTQPPKMAGARCCPCLCFNPKFLYVDELEFVVYLLFFELYLFVTSVGLVFSQGVTHVAD